MALRIHALPLHALPRPPKSRLRPLRFDPRRSLPASVSCRAKGPTGDAEIASALAEEVGRVHAQKKQKDEALRKGRALLFAELCGYFSLGEEEVGEDGGRRAEGYGGGVRVELEHRFPSLSARSVVEMVEEHLRQEKKPSFSNDSAFFPSLKRLMGLGENQ